LGVCAAQIKQLVSISGPRMVNEQVKKSLFRSQFRTRQVEEGRQKQKKGSAPCAPYVGFLGSFKPRR